MCEKSFPAGEKSDGGPASVPNTLDTNSISSGKVSTLGRVSQWRPTEVLCIKDGVLLQLWVDRYGFREDREWRKLPSFEEASKTYFCTTIQ